MVVAATLWYLERRNARAMLQVERETLLEARRAIREAGAGLTDALGDVPELGTDRTRERAISRVQVLMPALAATLTTALLSGRRKARTAAAEVVIAEVKSLAMPGSGGFTLAGKAAATVDAAASQVRASALASSWGSAAIAKIEEALATEATSPKAAVAELTAITDRRADTTVSTETAAAFNDGKAVANDVIAEQPWSAGMYRTWSAYLDARTCSICWRKDGETVPIGQPFSDGLKPPAHPRCRCIETMIYIPKPAALEAIGWDYEAFKDEVLAELLEMKRGTRPTLESGQRYAPAYIELAEKAGSPKALTDMLHRGEFLDDDGPLARATNQWSHVLHATSKERERAFAPQRRAAN